MGVASPLNSRFLLQSVRVLTADLILDEIDQYAPEDIAAIGRLIYQTAAGGRRVIIMSATLTADVATALFEAYQSGWRAYATASGLDGRVNVLCAGDTAGACQTNADGAAFEQVFEASRRTTVAALNARPAQRIGRISAPCSSWAELVQQVDTKIASLHEATATEIGGVKVSVGFVRMTRIAHTVALATQLPAGSCNGRLRLKLCLHSQFPRLHRAWIERELKRALTRKGREPNAGLTSLLNRHELIQRVRDQGCTHLEIVVICSPVIETGNDLDFDWAIIDPSSMRAVVQAAGRVWRHRLYSRREPNVLILGRSPIVMQTGKLVLPGVETTQHGDTRVPKLNCDVFGDRHVSTLVGPHTFDQIDARAMIVPDNGPLQEKEAELRKLMIATNGEDAPLGCYLRHPTTRLNHRMTQSRKFRRSTTRDLLYFQDLDESGDPRTVHWRLDLAPGTRNRDPRRADKLGLRVSASDDAGLLFPNLDELSWRDRLGGSEAPTASDLRRLMRVDVPDYGDPKSNPTPVMTYCEWTGFTRGTPDDIFGAFGKAQSDHRGIRDIKKDP